MMVKKLLMNNLTVKNQKALYYRAISLIVVLAFAFSSIIPPSYAQSIAALNLPTPGVMITQSPSFVPVLIKGMIISPDDPFRFDFLVDSGNTNFSLDEIKKESERLVKYFLTSMTIPKDDLWVNLSPYESDKIIPGELGKTELGRDMLSQDYILKQLTASLLYPEKELGKNFWDRVYKKAQEKFGTAEIPINTFNKVWIIPEEALVYENGNVVYIVKSRLKVMLEEDYQAMQQNRESAKLGPCQLSDSEIKSSASLSSQIVRDIILPEIEREVNEGKNFAPIRQIYQALILAKWYKETIKESLLSKVYIDQKKIMGVDLSDTTVKDRIYAQYVEAFKKGVFNFIKEDYDQVSQKFVPKKYFSGGEKFGDIPLKRTEDASQINFSPIGNNYKLVIRINPQSKTGDKAIIGNDSSNAGPLMLKETNTNRFEFDTEGLDIAFEIFDSKADVPDILKRLSWIRGIEKVDWRDGVLTILSETAVVKVHPKDLEINERHQIKDRFYVKPSSSCGEMAVKIYHSDSRDNKRKHDKPVYVLGVVRPSHDAGAALIKDGVLVGAIEEERLNLDKHTNAYFPKEATRYLLEANGITWENLDHIAVTYDYNFYWETPSSKEPHHYYRQKHNLPFKNSYRRYDINKFQSFLEDMAVDYGTGYIPPVTFVKHHKAHAAAAYYSSGFTEPTLVVSIDGQGEDESTTIWLAKDGKLNKIARTTPFTHSLGHFYHIITVYLGYRRHDEGKIMGYAPYGAPRNAEEEKIVFQLREMMQELIRFNQETEQIEMNPEDFELTTIPVFPGVKFSESFLQRLAKIVPPMPEGKSGRDLSPEDRNRAHLAFAMQERVEQVINDIISYYLNDHDETKGVQHVVMAGGLALNIASNGKLIENGTVEADKFFVPAYPADDGTSVGAALSVADEEYGLDIQHEVRKISFGKTYSDEEIQNVLDCFGLVEGVDYEYIGSDEQLVEEVADAIVDDKTVAWFQGGAELGPRALGNRSILNRLNDPEGNFKVNRIKNREPWRPSALSIQEERAAEFLDGVNTSPFMTISFPVTKDKKDIIKAGVHPGDGTTRPQTVAREANSLYWSLLGEMGERTGVPGVLNTSFNRRGPIVETPEDALNTYFYGDGLDVLAIGHFILRQKDRITPSVLNGVDEVDLKEFFKSKRYKSKPLTKAWDEFWAEANNLVASRGSEHQHSLMVNVDDAGENREILRVPLIKEMFQEGSREFIIADLAGRIQRGIGRDTLTTIAIETTAPQFREIVVDLFEKLAPDDLKRNWNIVKLGFGERSSPKEGLQQRRVNSTEAVEDLNRNIQKWQEEQRNNPIFVAVTGPNESGRTSVVNGLHEKHFVINAARWNLVKSQINNSLNYPFSHMRFNDYVNALERLQQGQTAMIPLQKTLLAKSPQRGFVSLNEEMKEKYKSILVKESSKVWVRHDGQLFEEVRPESSDIFVVNTSVALNYPVLQGLFKEVYFVATNEELKELSRKGKGGVISPRMRGVKFADTIVKLDAASRGDKTLTSWIPLKVSQPIKQFDSICIALTNYCPVGCQFCFMRSVQDKRKKISLDPRAIERILSYAKENQVFRLMLSGGEPLTEMATVLRVIREAEVPNITIFTSGYFAANESRAEKVLNQLVEALREREQAGKKPINILFELSVDEFHTRRVSQKNIINIIKAFERHWNTRYADISLELKGILKNNDPIPELIQSLDGKIQEVPQDGPFPTKPIILPSGYTFTVRYSEIKLLKDMLGTELAKEKFDKVYQRRLEEDVIYVGRGERNGISFSVNYDGVVSVNDYLAKDFQFGNVNNDNFFEDVDKRLTLDPFVIALREIGLNTVLDIASRLRPNIRKRSIETNNQFVAVADILEDDELRDYVYRELIKLIEDGNGLGISSRPEYQDENDLHKEAVISSTISGNAQTLWEPLSVPQKVDHFSNILISLTNFCPVQCTFCWLRAVSDKKKAIKLSSEAIDKILRYVKEKAVPVLDVTGGEALSEMETVLRIIREAEVQRISISTSGYFATSESKTEEVVDQLALALREREQAGRAPIKIDFRVSVDEFHWHVSSKTLTPIIRVFEKYNDSKYKDIILELRGMLTAKDPVPDFIKEMGGDIKEDPNRKFPPINKIILDSGYSFNIKYAEVKLVDEILNTEVAETDFDNVYRRRINEENILIGKEMKDGGVILFVSHDGGVSLQAFLSKKFPLTNIYNDKFFEEIDRRLTLDPLVVALGEIGLNAVLDIASRFRPNIRDRSIEANNMFMAVTDIIEDEDLRKYVYKELIQLIESSDDHGRLDVPSEDNVLFGEEIWREQEGSRRLAGLDLDLGVKLDGIYKKIEDQWNRLLAAQGSRVRVHESSFDKYDENGKQKPFEGVTIGWWFNQDNNSKIYNGLLKLQDDLRRALKEKELDAYFSFHEPKDLHMTVYDLITVVGLIYKEADPSGHFKEIPPDLKRLVYGLELRKESSLPIQVEKFFDSKVAEAFNRINDQNIAPPIFSIKGVTARQGKMISILATPKSIEDMVVFENIRKIIYQQTGVELMDFFGHITLAVQVKDLSKEQYVDFIDVLRNFRDYEIGSVELKKIEYRKFVKLTEFEDPKSSILLSHDERNIVTTLLSDNAWISDVSDIDLNSEVFIIGDGRIELGGSVTVKGNRNQIRFQGENQENLVIRIGKGLIMEDCFISLRRSQGQARVEWQGDTLVTEEMSIGENVKITKGGEVMNVPKIGDDVEIEGSFLIEMDEGGVGDRAKILGNSEARLSSIGSDVVVDQQSKIFKSIVSSEAQIINVNLIGGQDELVGGWRQKDEEGKGRGVVIGKDVEFRNGLAHHKGVKEGKVNPITVADGVKLDGVFLISEHNKGIHVMADLELESGQRVYIHDGVIVDEEVKTQIQNKLVTSDIVKVNLEAGTVKIEGVLESLVIPKLLNVPQLKNEYAMDKTRDIPKVFSIDTIQDARDLNDLLLKSDVFISRAGEVVTSREGRDDIAIRIGQGTFVYPGVKIYVNDGRTVNINLWDLGNRGGALVIADEKDVQIGPKDQLAGRIVAAVIRDVNVDAEFNNFGGIADTIVGNTKITIRNQGVLKNANLSSDGKGRGEIIWGGYQGKNVDIEVIGDVNVGLSYGGIIEGQSLGEGSNSIKLVSGFNSGYRTVIRDERQEPVEPIVYDSSYKPTDFAMMSSSSLSPEYGGIDMNEIKVKHQGSGVDIRFNTGKMQTLIEQGIDGFVPVIIYLTPIDSIMPLLGLEPRNREEEYEVSSLN